LSRRRDPQAYFNGNTTQHSKEQQQQTPSSTSMGFFQAYINNTLFPVLIVAKIVLNCFVFKSFETYEQMFASSKENFKQ
jgi:hypothetical protein